VKICSHKSFLSFVLAACMLLSMHRRSGAHCIELTTKAGGLVLNSAHESARRHGLKRLVHAQSRQDRATRSLDGSRVNRGYVDGG
jgi:hypothetical protein